MEMENGSYKREGYYFLNGLITKFSWIRVVVS